MIDVPRNAIASLLRELRGGGSFATRRTVAGTDLAIEVTDVGAVRLPVTAAQAKALRLVSRPAKYGHGEATLLDRQVRDTWEVPRSRVRIDQRRWNRTLLPMLDAIRADLGLPDGSRLRAELHSMLVYEPGQFFASHQDSEKHDTMIATLVVLLPSRSTGGDLVIEHRSKSARYRGSATSLVFVAFYADTRHEALPVQSGYRVALTYNLLLTGDGSAARPPAGPVDEVAAHLGRHFTHTPPPRWRGDRASVEPPDRLVVLLDHQYTERGLRWSHLKSDDAERAEVLRRAAELAGCDVALAQAEIHETRECYDDTPRRRRRRGWDDDDDEPAGDLEVGDLLDVAVTIAPAVTERVRFTSVVDEFEIAEVTPTAALLPHGSEYTGYMGNWGNTIDRWYRRAAIVIWPRSRAFALRAKNDPAGAIDELLTEPTTGARPDTTQRERIDTLLRFWPTAVRTGDQRQLMPRALRLAARTADPHLAERLLEPFAVEAIDPSNAAALIALGDQHGLDSLQRTLTAWTDQSHTSTTTMPRATWTATLPDLCTRLRDEPASAIGTATARTLTAHISQWLIGAVGDATQLVTPSRRASALGDLAAPTLAVLHATAIADLTNVREQILTALRSPRRPLANLLVGVIEAAAPLPAAERTIIGIDTLAAHARDALAASLAQPPRATDNWSIDDLPATCCEDCATLAAFLAEPLVRRLTWPLAKPRRQHIHHRLDEAELPVTHTTTRQGSPHKLVLTKTPELHRRDAETRRATEQALATVERYLDRPT